MHLAIGNRFSFTKYEKNFFPPFYLFFLSFSLFFVPFHTEQHVFVCLAIFAFHIPHVISLSILIKSNAFSARPDSLFIFLVSRRVFFHLGSASFPTCRQVNQFLCESPHIIGEMWILKTLYHYIHNAQNGKCKVVRTCQ